MAKHKGKRNKDRRSGSEPVEGDRSTSRPMSAVPPSSAVQRGSAATGRPAATQASERPGATVIQFPKAPLVPAEAVPVEAAEVAAPVPEAPANVSTRPTMRAGSDPAVTTPPASASTAPAESAPPAVEGGEAPETPTGADAPSESSGAKTAVLGSTPPVKPEASAAVEQPGGAAVPSAESPAATPAEAEAVVPRRAVRRERKESLSTHLSEEAQAFFSDASLEGAYKVKHDDFDDLKPIASTEHARELQSSRRWMAITGAMLFGVVALVVGFSIAGRMGVSETSLDTSRIRNIPEPTPPAPSLPESSPPPEPPPAAATPSGPPADAPPAPPATGAAPTAAPTPSGAPPAAAAPAPDAPVAAPTPPVAAPPAPAAGDPASLLTAARTFRGPFAGRVAAWEAYFTADPSQDRLMADRAFDWAEGHPAEAERIATRAVSANPSNSKAWFVLAYTRGRLGNAAGRREALSRCIALGGQYAAECRAL